MKLSNLVLAFVLAVIASFSVCAQSQTIREVSIDNDEESVYIKYENDVLIELNIDGEAIPKGDFNKYTNLLDRYTKNSPKTPTPPKNTDLAIDNRDMGSILNKRISQYLVEIGLMNTDKYKIKLTPNYIKVNGKKVDEQIHNKCLSIFEQTVGHQMSTGSVYKVRITSNSKSITLSIED